MPPQTLERRVESLESRVTVLEQLPARFDALALQISQMREEIRGEFSALRTEMRTGDEETRRSLRDDMHTEFSALRTEMRTGDEETRRSLRDDMHTEFSALRNEIRAGDEETRRVLGDEIRAGDETVMTHARVLHEELIARQRLMEEGRRPRKRADTRGDPQ